MNVIAIGAFGTALTVSLSAETGHYENVREIGLQHNQSLMNLIETVTAEAAFSMADLDVIIVTQGPGSFTALRILLSTAKGIAAARSTPLVTIPTFDLFGDFYSFFRGTVVPVIDGRKHRYYSAFYKNGEKIFPENDEPREVLIEKLLQNSPALILGEDGPDLFPGETPPGIHVVPYSIIPGRHLIDYGIKMYKRGQTNERSVSPLYVRKSDAELKRDSENERERD